MGYVIIQKYTTEFPLQLMGEEAGICWGASTSNKEKNYKRGLDCLQSGHGRVSEYPQIYMVLDGYSARVIREFYTHIAGGPTRLQASTRYIDYEHGFDYIIPPSIKEGTTEYVRYVTCMQKITTFLQQLDELGVPKEDSANLLPLGMTTKIVVRTNLRNLIDMSHQRLCTRAYWEYRQLMRDIMKALKEYSEEWDYIVDNYFQPKCELSGYCIEKKCCGRKKTQKEIENSESIIFDDCK